MKPLTKAELDTLTDAELLEALRRALSKDIRPSGTARAAQRQDLETELQAAVRALFES